MRIVVIGPHFVARWTESVSEALRSLGHAVVMAYYDPSLMEMRAVRVLEMSVFWSSAIRCDLRLELIKKLISVRSRRLIRLVSVYQPDVVILLKGEPLSRQILQEIRSHVSGAFVTWWADDPFQFPEFVEASSLFDVFFVFDQAYISRLRDAGAPQVTLLPCACDPRIYCPQNLSFSNRRRYACDLAFVALYYPPRERLVEQLAGMDLAIWGPGWQGAEARRSLEMAGVHTWRGERLPAWEVAKVYNAAKICLNVHHPQSLYNGLNKRAFEILACGAFELMDNLPGVDSLLTPGKEVVCFNSFDEARELADYYLRRPDIRAEIGRRGRERVLRDHTYRNRMQTLLATVDNCL